MNENVLVVGASSGIARALCHVLARRGCGLVLAGRQLDELEQSAGDLRIRYQSPAFAEPFEATDFAGHASFFQRCAQRFEDGLSGIVLAYGILGNQADAQADFVATRQVIDVDFTSAASVLELAARYFESRHNGYLAAISSVAGDRGRQSNYVYGAAKAGLSAYLQGLRNRLQPSGVHVLTVKPGFVDTPMTRGRINPRSPLVATPERVARDIDRAIRARQNVLYTPWFWRPIMAVVRAIPEPVFKRLRL